SSLLRSSARGSAAVSRDPSSKLAPSERPVSSANPKNARGRSLHPIFPLVSEATPNRRTLNATAGYEWPNLFKQHEIPQSAGQSKRPEALRK
ncbi:hypothetical protein, partial [Bradyrhizobium cosmicum]|uniref:hypothetical protein n=1 Tax=Bradyrhizobium cosmicum TaxID=1404864 RepID=UPI0028F111BC